MAKVVIMKISAEEVVRQKVDSWPVWEKEVSRFNWVYEDTEECYILEGEITIETNEGDYQIVSGDFVTFQKGLSCIWDIKKPVKKHYNFL